MTSLILVLAGLCIVMLLISAIRRARARARIHKRRSRRIKTLAFERSWNQIMRRHDKPKRITYKTRDPLRRD